jgi:hypothetical protein
MHTPAPKAFTGLPAHAASGPAAGSATTVGLMAYDRSGAEGILDGLPHGPQKVHRLRGLKQA